MKNLAHKLGLVEYDGFPTLRGLAFFLAAAVLLVVVVSLAAEGGLG